ncbi:PREDICTED: protein C2-DOMAIN ABA-RELATED 4-like isoform X1 [Nelumbo nucifera]|uniref:Protein C2-DOMAIN ABA-RELATED 4-like isoform X1 n=1 Tax=Nelumbo nucifera TaxID=4432 RepID=A0A1U8AAT6_NELNU|nr:PREDICTED: protein C2-DOMAIN ABA-RELATED 4-like isoform X1 [Nelumbo nucifera]
MESPGHSPNSSHSSSLSMESLLGLLRIHIHRGINLAVRDVVSSDPYIVIKMGKQKLKTRVMKKNINPEWNEDLTLSVADPELPIKLTVYDKDKFSLDDKMGDADIDIKPFLEAVKMHLVNLPSGTIIQRVQPNRQNCLAEESCIIWQDGKVVQDMYLRLKNVESGEVELQLQWIDIPGSRGI